MKSHCSAKGSQKGAVFALFVIAMVVIIGIAGLALDMSHAYVDKTRMQNLLDAAALSAAMTQTLTGSTSDAEADGRATLAAGLADAGELESLDLENDVLFEFSHDLDPFVDTAVDPVFVRVSISSFNMKAWLMQVLNKEYENVSLRASAVAGPAYASTCELAPFWVCGDPTDDACLTNPNAPTCFGYNVWRKDGDLERECLLKSKDKDATNASAQGCGPQSVDDYDGYGPGNFGLVDLSKLPVQSQCTDYGGGANFAMCAANKSVNACPEDLDIYTLPGGKVGPIADGINSNLGIYSPPLKPSDKDTFSPDLVTDHPINDGDPVVYFKEYQQRLKDGPLDEPVYGKAGQRIKNVIIGECPVGGKDIINIYAIGCFYLTREAVGTGKQQVFGQFLGECGGGKNLIPSPSAFTNLKIILYKDHKVPDSPDS